MRNPPARLESAAIAGAWLSVLLTMATLGALLVFLLWRSLPAWSVPLFFGDTPPLDALLRAAPVFDGLWPACAGTLALVALTTLIAVPLGVGSGIYLAEYAAPRTRAVLSFGIDVLAGLPSILIGLFGFALLLLLRRTLASDANTGLLLSAFCLAVLVLPYLINTTRLALASLPPALRLTAASLGLSHRQAVTRVLLPAAAPGIFSGILLAIGRAAEDTAVILMTGAVATAGLPTSLTGSYEALPFYIYVMAAEHQSPADLARAFAAAVVLLTLTALLLGLARRLQARLEKTWHRGAAA